jgi:hypothetical protein
VNTRYLTVRRSILFPQGFVLFAGFVDSLFADIGLLVQRLTVHYSLFTVYHLYTRLACEPMNLHILWSLHVNQYPAFQT